MKIHHINCGCLKPFAAQFFPAVFPPTVVCHCMLIETKDRLVLVDTGLGRRDLENPKRLGLMGSFGIERDQKLTAYEQIKSLGLSPDDVTDLIPTHLDFDHAGGVEDFPQARVHISTDEYQACYGATDFKLKFRYKSIHYSHEVKWRLYEEKPNSEWKGFARAQPLKDLPEEISAVRLPGHSPGHFGVVVETSDGPLLHAGDAYYNRNELKKLPTQIGLTIFQKLAHFDYKVAMQTQAKLSALEDVKVFCAHDRQELTSMRSVSR